MPLENNLEIATPKDLKYFAEWFESKGYDRRTDPDYEDRPVFFSGELVVFLGDLRQGDSRGRPWGFVKSTQKRFGFTPTISIYFQLGRGEAIKASDQKSEITIGQIFREIGGDAVWTDGSNNILGIFKNNELTRIENNFPPESLENLGLGSYQLAHLDW